MIKIYHTGYLPVDRKYNKELNEKANYCYKMYKEGNYSLTQKKIRDSAGKMTTRWEKSDFPIYEYRFEEIK